MGEKELLIIEFGMKLVLFRIGMGMFFQRKVKRWWLEVLGYMFFSCLCIWGRMSSMELEGILWLIIISLQFLTIRVSDVKQYGWIVVQIFVVCYIEEIGRMVVADVVNIDSTAEMQKWMDLAGNLLAIWILGILFCISLVVGDRSDFFYKEKYRRYMRNGIIGAVGFVAVEMIWCAVVLHYLPDLIPDTLLEKLPDLKLISLLAMAGIGVLIIFVAYIHHSNEKLEELLKENQSLRQKEVGYYEGRLKQDEETRVYRHNMDGQILWLRALVSQGDLQQTLLKPQMKLFVYGIITSLMITLLGIVSSLFNNVLFDEILPYKQENVLKMVIIVFLGFNISQVVVSFVRQWMMMHLSIKIDIPLMLGYFKHIYKLPMKFFATRKTGDITTRFSDAFTIKDVFTNIALTLILDIGMALITGVILFRMNSGLFAIIIFMTIVSVLLVFIFKQPYKKINEEQMHQSAVLNSQIIEGLRAVETIKGNANEEVELDNIEREYIRSLRISYKEGMLSNVQGVISQLISTAGDLILMYFGIMQVLKGNITLGSYMAFNTLSGYFMEPVSNLVGLQLSLQEANISMKRFSEILDYEEEQPEAEKNLYQDIEKIEGDIEIKHVTFRYGMTSALQSRRARRLHWSVPAEAGKPPWQSFC